MERKRNGFGGAQFPFPLIKLQNITPSPQELTMQLNVQKQLNEELRISCHEQEQRLKDVHLENVHMQALQFKRLMDEDENQRNVDKRAYNTSGYKGVSFVKRDNKWGARARLDGKTILLGQYETPEPASQAYQEVAKKHHGEFYFEHNARV